MKQPATFNISKSDCPVSMAADEAVIRHLDRSQFDVAVTNVSRKSAQIAELGRFGVKSLPPLVISSEVFPINLAITVAELKINSELGR